MDSNLFKSNGIVLGDFKNVTRYLDKDTGKHKNKQKTNMFRGNLMFASPNQINYRTTSRRDDIMSLFYLLLFLLNGANIEGVPVSEQAISSQQDILNQLLIDNNQVQNLRSLAITKPMELSEFKKEAFRYSFKDQPNYDHLRNILKKHIL